ncbi:hypothetical protein [Gemmatimonas sp.]|jgi:hypothetical protein
MTLIRTRRRRISLLLAPLAFGVSTACGGADGGAVWGGIIGHQIKKP